MAAKKEKKELDFQSTIDELNKKYGKGTIGAYGDHTENYDVIPSGSIEIDYKALGVGGFVKGKLYEIKGWEGAGKSTLCGHLVAETQRKGGKAVYIDGEHAVDLNYFQKLGVNINEMLLAQPDYGEEGFEIARMMAETGEVDLIIIDSDSALQPKSVMEGEIGQSAIGRKAVLNNSAYPKLKLAVSNNNVCLIAISQVREKIGVMFGSPETTQGGHALKFYADTIIDLRKTLKKEGDETSGNITKLKATKNKTYKPHVVGEFDVIFGVGIDKIGEILNLGNEFEIWKKWGSTITYEENKYPLDEFENMLRDNDEFREKIREQIIEKIKDNR